MIPRLGILMTFIFMGFNLIPSLNLVIGFLGFSTYIHATKIINLKFFRSLKDHKFFSALKIYFKTGLL